MDFNFLIGGEAGQGVQSMGYILALSLVKGGYNVFSNQDYESRVRGGHNSFKIRVSEREILAVSEIIDLMVALNEETINLHNQYLADEGVIIYDNKIRLNQIPPYYLGVPFEEIALEKTGYKIMSNTVALGAALSLIKYDFSIFSKILTNIFSKKSSEIANKNVQAAKAGYDYVQEEFKIDFVRKLLPLGISNKMVVNGNEALALGALASDCKFIGGYPMTPTTSILQYFASKSVEMNVVFEQAEDEIAALNMVIGAAYTGIRAMTATSGGGFSLMVEALSLAGMTETPVVIILGQRPGPATGLPTRTEQGELEFAIHAGHGMFPRVVFAPGTAEEAFYLVNKAFNIAEKYQVPAIILTDTYLADSYVSVNKFDLNKIKFERGEFLSEDDLKTIGRYNYMRHKFTDSGVSPRVIPGTMDALVVTDSDEHTEDGHITESPEIRNQMVNKRIKKFTLIQNEIAPPNTYGPLEASIVLVGWGSTFGALKEGVDLINEDVSRVRMIHMSEIWPFPKKAFLDLINGSEKVFVVESNATGQMARLIRAETGYEVTSKILRYDGRPITPQYIINHLVGEVGNKW